MDLLFIRDINKKYRGKVINLKLLKDIITEVTNKYIKDGFITSRAYVAQQDLSSEVLTVTLVEGVIDEIIIKNKNIVSKKSDYTAPLSKNKVLNLRDIY